MIYFLILFYAISSFANNYKEIPKIFNNTNDDVKNLKFGYNITQNLSQNQSLFFIEGVVNNNRMNHTSRYDISTARTKESGVTLSRTRSNLLRTTTFLPFLSLGKKEEEKNIFTGAGTIYGRLYNFSDQITPRNNLKDQIIMAGLGFSRTNIYTIGFSVGKRNADVFFGNAKMPINEYIYRPSIVYTNTMENTVPMFIQKILQKHNIYNIAITENSLKIEYALISGNNTNIQQFYIGFDKNISKHLLLSIFYDYEKTKNSNSLNNVKNVNDVRKIATSLVIKL